MRIETLHIDNFGNHTSRNITDLSNRLNILQATDDETRHSAFQFLRWMLFGNCDESCNSAVGRTGTTPAGSLTVMQDGQRRTVARRDDGTRYGRVAVDGADRFSPQTNHMVSLLGTVTQSDFDHLFAPRFHGERYLAGLFQAARSHGIDLVNRTIPTEHRQALLRRIELLRVELGQQRFWDETWGSLRERHRTLVLRIESAERDLVRRRADLESELRRIRDDMNRLHGEIEVCRERWRVKDDEVDARRSALERTWQEAERARHELRHRLHTETAELETLVTRWSSVIEDIRHRCDWISKVLMESEEDMSPEERSQRCHVASLAAGIERLRSDLTTWGEYPRRHELAHTDWQSVRERVAHGLDELRSLTSGVCETLRDQREHDRFRVMHEELDHLQQCESALGRWLETVEKQRNQLQRELAAANRNDVSVVWNDGHYEQQGKHYRWDGIHGTLPRTHGGMRAVFHACDAIDPVDPHTDRVLRDLTDQRETLARELSRTQERSRELHSRQTAVEAELARMTDRTLDDLRRELADVEHRLLECERRGTLEAELRRLEDEERSLPDDVYLSPVIEHASDLVQQLSLGHLHRLQVDGTLSVSVLDPSGNRLAWGALGEPHRNDIQLALCLACVAALRRQGMELPLLLHDATLLEQGGLDRHHAEAWVSVLSHFASAGHQVLLFTGSGETRDLFGTREHRFIPLDRTVLPERPVLLSTPPVVDQVRFKRRPGAELDWTSRDNETWETPLPVRRETNRDATVRPLIERGEGEPLNVIHWETVIDRSHLIDIDAGRALRAAGLGTVRRFVETEEHIIEEYLRAAGVTERPIRRWQDELEMACWLRDLPVEDARILVACGIRDVGELADASAEALYQQMARYLAANPEIRRSGRALSSELVARWIDSARYCRQSWSGSARRDLGTHAATMPMMRQESDAAERRAPQRDTEHRRRGDARADDVALHGERRTRRRRPQAGYTSSNGQGSVIPQAVGSPKGELRFYLNLEDPVVDAPSIGPRMATHLAEAGIRTVRELLEVNPDTLADRLSGRRVTAKMVREWQAQTTLACRIPELRGHDAQILVACDVTDPDQLSAMDENELWSRVRPFVRTAEGKRIVRSGKAPDLDEVREWITWARNARTLRAA